MDFRTYFFSLIFCHLEIALLFVLKLNCNRFAGFTGINANMWERYFDSFAIEGFFDFDENTVFNGSVIGLLEPNAKRNINAAIAKRLEKNIRLGFFQTKWIVAGNVSQHRFYFSQIFFISHPNLKIEPADGESGYIG